MVESRREWPDPPGKSPNRITLFRDTNRDGMPDLRELFLTGLTRPYGMALLGDWFYVGNEDGVVRFPYRAGQTRITAGLTLTSASMKSRERKASVRIL